MVQVYSFVPQPRTHFESTQNAFSSVLSEFIPNFFDLFVPDFLHEWELGVWKQLLIHLVRILYAEKRGRVEEFNARYVDESYS